MFSILAIIYLAIGAIAGIWLFTSIIGSVKGVGGFIVVTVLSLLTVVAWPLGIILVPLFFIAIALIGVSLLGFGKAVVEKSDQRFDNRKTGYPDGLREALAFRAGLN